MADGLGLFRFADARDEEDLTETTDSDTAMDLRFLATPATKKMAFKRHAKILRSSLKWFTAFSSLDVHPPECCT